MKIKLCGLLILLPIFIGAMEGQDERQHLVPPSSLTMMQDIRYHVDEFNTVLDREMPQQKTAFVLANFGKATLQLAAAAFLAGGALCCITNPALSLATMGTSAACLCSSMNSIVYADNLSQVPDPSNPCIHAGANTARLMCCVMASKNTSVQPSQPETYDEL